MKPMSTQDVADYLQWHEITVGRYARMGKLPGVKKKGQWIFNKDTLDQWMVEGKCAR